jgi:hypothetical protein
MIFRHRLSSRALAIYFLIGIALIGIVTFIYSNYLIQRIKTETETTSRLFAEFARGPSVDEERLVELFYDMVIRRIDFPVVLTDVEGTPYSSKNVQTEDLYQAVEKLDRVQKPIPMVIKHGADSTLLGHVHWGLSPFTRSLQILPFVETVFLIAFLFLGFWGYLVYRKSVEEKIWNSLAKETAHQLATPLSSLVGWLETIRGQIDSEIYAGIHEDAARMREVLEKFSRIGLPPRLVEKDPTDVIKNSVNYMKRRAHANIEFKENYGKLPAVKFDDVLLGWAIENILKNGLDAIGANPGEIKIRTHDMNGALIEITDTGRGIKSSRNIFKPGYTTKKYGWGLGLVLTKRIVEEYHKGRLSLRETSSKGTCFEVYLPGVFK